ncbi:hypothetical protein ABFS82_09G093600 [Erythranthe guttata]|uniref:AMP-dependent synthetase/ligase domain-containing protein n=1 Tax=Erythranthe guttata TaxID=4155 RepID=A0A022Q1I6_ERYGU|nr:PREDICTED: probable acyl-activating enzyme 2 [Erythranthe guttata]EYU21629.1 hypothetical protein MIMGU_mgv1a007880mg [Erythranthe guttata]|eukprot:XP_012856224.1 PREDICTED: probable acyl-activating enzyme 2 [Erythranthe guttata]
MAASLWRRCSLNTGWSFTNVAKKVHPALNHRCQRQFSVKESVKREAKHAPLSPVTFLERAAEVHGDRISVVYGALRFTWGQTLGRCANLAAALSKLGISRGDVVAILAPNIPAMQELHFAVPMAGAIICTLNPYDNPNMISILLQHSEAKIIFVDHQFLHKAQQALDLVSQNNLKPPILVLIPEYAIPFSCPGTHDYETLVASGDSQKHTTKPPKTEQDPISIHYTSEATPPHPKRVVRSHREAYVNTLATASIHGLRSMNTVYLWTVPISQFNGGDCLIWGLAALGGTNVFLTRVSAKEIFESIFLNSVTHMGGSRKILNMIVNSTDRDRKVNSTYRDRNEPPSTVVEIMADGILPLQPPIVSKIEELGFRLSPRKPESDSCLEEVDADCM